MNTLLRLCAITTFALLGKTALAGIILVGTHQNAEEQTLFSADHPAYTINYSATDITIEGDTVHGRTEVDLLLPTNAPGTVAYMLLPEGAVATAIQTTSAKRPVASQPPKAALLPEAGRELLMRIIKEAHLETLAPHIDCTPISIDIGENSGKHAIAVSWHVKARRDQGIFRLRTPMPISSLSTGPVRRAVLNASITTHSPLRAVFSPSHDCNTTHTSEQHARVRLTADQLTDDQPFELIAITGDDDLGLRVFTHRPTADEDGHFLLVGCPTQRSEQSVPKEIVFVVDTSGSMRGDKMEQARASLEYCLQQLTPRDRFNIIAFADATNPFKPSPVVATPDNVSAAQDFVDALEPDGRTNIDDVLALAVTATKKTDTLPATRRLVIFLTDGTPTVGERRPDAILSRATKANTSNARVFTMGIGHEVNAYLLDRLALETEGDSEYVDPEQDLDQVVASLYNRLAHPVMLGAVVDFGELDVYDVTPAKLPDLYRDTLVMVAGRYRKAATGEVRIHNSSDDHSFARTITLQPTSQTDAFVPPLWASRRLGDTLEQVRLHGETDELLKQTVQLSRRYGILTEYTAIINAPAAANMSDDEVVAEARKQVSAAREAKSGKWAVMQSKNGRGLQQRIANNAEINTYVDAQGEKQQADNVRQIGSTAFYNVDGKWVTADDGKKRTQRVVEKFSEEYFELVGRDKNFSRAAALGKEVVVNVGDEQLLVK